MYLERSILIRKGTKSLYDYCQENPDKLYLLEEWDYKENERLGFTPKTIGSASSKKVWWICSKSHKWQATPNNRKSGNSCSYCSNQKLLYGYNDMETTHPWLAKEWDYEKNYPLTPKDIIAGTAKKYWWKCNYGHSWQAASCDRTQGKGCPYCNPKGTSLPELAIYYYLFQIYSDTIHRHKINGLEFDLFIPSLNLAIEYDSAYYHKDKINKDIAKDEFCKKNNMRLIRLRNKKLQETPYAEIIFIDEKHTEQDIIALFQLLNLTYSFNIDINTDYNNIINEKFHKIQEKSISATHPEIAAEWHSTKNGNLKPEYFSYGSEKKVWWQCLNHQDHVWEESINKRIKRTGCPYCNNYRILKGYNDLASQRPDIALDWNYEKNYPLTPEEVTCGSGKKVWWKCHKCNYEWQATIDGRIKESSCHRCSGRLPYTKEEIDIIEKYFKIEGPTELMKRLPNRSARSISQKAHKILNSKNKHNS